MKYTINVTQQDIQDGTYPPLGLHRADTCPIACAIKRELGVGYSVFSALMMIRKGKRTMFNNEKVTNFILDFDCGLPVLPFTFEVEC
jgi:hypothetical protein